MNDYFKKRPTDGQFKGYTVLTLTATQGIADADKLRSPIMFSYDEINLSIMPMVNNISASVWLKIVNKSTKQIPADSECVSVCNNLLNSLFEDVVVKINGQNINSKTDKRHQYVSILGRYLSYNTEVKDTSLSISGWHDDDRGQKDSWSTSKTAAAGSNGFINRRKPFCKAADGEKFKETSTVLIGNIDYELSSLPTGIPPGMKVHWTFEQTQQAIRVCQPKDMVTEYICYIEDMQLHVPICHLSDYYFKHLTKQLDVQPAKLHYTRSEFKINVVPKTRTTISVTNLFDNQIIPVRIYVAFVDWDAYNGHVNKDPFK